MCCRLHHRLPGKLLILLLCAPQILCCLVMLLGVCAPANAAKSPPRSAHSCCGQSHERSKVPPSNNRGGACPLCASWNALISKRPVLHELSPLDLLAAPVFAQIAAFEPLLCETVRLHDANVRACSMTLLDLCCQFTN